MSRHNRSTSEWHTIECPTCDRDIEVQCADGRYSAIEDPCGQGCEQSWCEQEWESVYSQCVDKCAAGYEDVCAYTEARR